MEILFVIIVAAVVFGLCFVVDKGFNRTFRSTPQHASGLSVRFNKRYGSIGLVVSVLGVAALFAGMSNSKLLFFGGIFLILVGIGLVTYYMTFGIYYDDEQFVVTTFGKRSRTYYYRDITAQQLFISYGNVIIELYLQDKRSVHLQTTMDGVYPFLDHAFTAWLRQTGRKKEDCSFYDPDNSCWFPTLEV